MTAEDSELLDADETVVTLAANSPEALRRLLAAGKWGEGTGPCRLALVDPTPERVGRARRIVERGAPWRGHSGIWFTPKGLATIGGRVAFLFPGVEVAFELRVEDVAARFELEVPEHSRPRDLEETGVGVVAVNWLLNRALGELGVTPEAVAGHSVGEWSAMMAGGMVPESDIDALVRRLQPGTLEVPDVLFAAAACGFQQATAVVAGLEEITVSHDNCPHQVILCGKAESLNTARRRLGQGGVLCHMLPFRSGFHSPLFESYLAPYREGLAMLRVEPAKIPVWSATTCAPFPNGDDAIRALAIDHLVKPVRFRELIEMLYEDNFWIFIQVGIGSLIGFVDDTLKDRPHLAITANDPRRSGLAQLRRVAAALFVEGVAVDLDRLAPPLRHPIDPVPLDFGTPLVEPDLSLGVSSALPAPATDAVVVEFGKAMRALADAQRDVRNAYERFVSQRTGSTHTMRRTLSVQAEPTLFDHCFFRQPEKWDCLVDRYPLVPMTMMIELMLEAARGMSPGLLGVAVERFRAHRWLAVEPPAQVTITARPEGPDAVHVTVGDYAEATVRLAPDYPNPAVPDAGELENPRDPPIDAERLYKEGWMFHGPAYQGVVQLGPIGDDGIRGVLDTTPGPGALLDSAGQLFGYWIGAMHETDQLAMPMAIERLELFGPHPNQGERVACLVRVVEVTDTNVRCNIKLTQGDRVWAHVTGWSDRRFGSDPQVWRVLRLAESNLLSWVRDPYVLFDSTQCRFPSRTLLMQRYLGEPERRMMLAAGPRGQRDFLNGRIAAKDAVRQFLWNSGHGPLFPVEILIENDPSGRPQIRGLSDHDLRISIAHSKDVAVAIVAMGRDVGIDLERIEPRPESFEDTVLTTEEHRFLDAGDRAEWLTRLWCAKEAAAKACGTGLKGNPRKVVVSEAAGERLRVDGRWVETRIDRDYVIAWTEG